MTELKERIHDENNSLDYILVGDYYIPDLKLSETEETRPIGKWGRMHLKYLREYCPAAYAELYYSGRLTTYLADINEQAQERLELITKQMKEAEVVTEELKHRDWWKWVQMMGNIQNRAEEIVLKELIYQ